MLPSDVEPIGELHYHRLLVAVDGSPSADLALSAAVTAARRDNAAVTVISVAPDLAAEAARWPWTGAIVQDQDAADRGAERVLREAVDRIPEDIPVTRVFRRGRAGPAIVAHAAEQPYDAILMGARGVGRVGALIGSVSSYVMHHADTAVFVAHAPRDGDAEPNPGGATP
jgi:nucleotide-binding universal stress UspA family protein